MFTHTYFSVSCRIEDALAIELELQHPFVGWSLSRSLPFGHAVITRANIFHRRKLHWAVFFLLFSLYREAINQDTFRFPSVSVFLFIHRPVRELLKIKLCWKKRKSFENPFSHSSNGKKKRNREKAKHFCRWSTTIAANVKEKEKDANLEVQSMRWARRRSCYFFLRRLRRLSISNSRRDEEDEDAEKEKDRKAEWCEQMLY